MATTETKFAVVGTDGTRAVVWGLGATEDDASQDASRHLDDQDPQRTNLLTIAVTSERAALIEAGDVDAEDLVEADGRGWIRERRTA